jgi:hypothetical protein
MLPPATKVDLRETCLAKELTTVFALEISVVDVTIVAQRARQQVEQLLRAAPTDFPCVLIIEERAHGCVIPHFFPALVMLYA